MISLVRLAWSGASADVTSPMAGEAGELGAPANGLVAVRIGGAAEGVTGRRATAHMTTSIRINRSGM